MTGLKRNVSLPTEYRQQLQSSGADFRQPENHQQALHEAARYGRHDAVRWFVDRGANPNSVNSGGSALSEAAYGNHPEIVRYLLSQGANVNLVFEKWGQKETALVTAIDKHTYPNDFEDHLAVVRALVAAGADPNFRGAPDELTPAESAEKSRALTMEKLTDMSGFKPAQRAEVRARLQGHVDHDSKLIAVLKR